MKHFDEICQSFFSLPNNFSHFAFSGVLTYWHENIMINRKSTGCYNIMALKSIEKNIITFDQVLESVIDLDFVNT